MNMLYPIFAMFALTIFVAVRMAVARHRAVRRGEVDWRYFIAYQGEEPEKLRVLSRHYANLLELPPLFYVLCLTAFVTGQNGILPVVLAWAFVALRFVHTAIHLGSNVVLLRFRVFALSTLVLTALAVVLFLGLV